MKKATAVVLISVLLFGLVPLSHFASAMYGTKIIDGSLSDWTESDLVAVGQNTGLAGANLDRLYVAWDDQYLYIAIKTNNTEHWGTVLGIGIDVDPGTGNGYVGADQDGNTSNGFEDIWWRDIGFGGGYAIDYELYFWYDSGNQNIGGGDFKHWNGAGWDDVGIGNVNYASSPSPSFGIVELAIPWDKLGGRPDKVAIITWLAGDGAHSSAIDTLPVDPAVDYPTVGKDEWTDKDILTNLAEIYVGTKTIDGDLSDWSENELAAQGVPSGIPGADLDKLYVSWDDQYLYIAIKTNNTAKYWPDYGIAIDVNPGSGNGGTTDPWSKNIQFSGKYLPDYIIYAEAQDGQIVWMGMHDWTGSSWGSMGNVKDIGDYAYTGGDQGIQTIELKIPWSAIGGMPSEFGIMVWAAGNNDGDSAVDTLPVDPAIDYSNIGSEWTDKDTLTNFAQYEIFIPVPELTVSMSGPGVVGLNRNAVYNVTVENKGSLSAQNASVRAYINGTLAANWTVSLEPGESRWFTFNWTPNATGTYTIRAVVDEENAIPEANEDNNEFVMNVQVVWVGNIDVDGNPDDWISVDISPNAYTVKNGYFIWKDPVGDQRKDKDPYLPGGTSSHADLTEVGVTKDDRYVYFLFEFADMSNIKIGDNGATFVAVPIDYKAGGANWFAGEMDTNSPLEWDIQMVVNLGGNQYKGETSAVAAAGDGKLSLLYFVKPDGNITQISDALVGVDLTKNTIEVRVPLSVFEGAKSFRFQVATGFSYGEAVWNFGNDFANDGISDIVDTITMEPTTVKELSDNIPDYYVTINMNNIIESAGMTTVRIQRLLAFQNVFIMHNKFFGIREFQREYSKYSELDQKLRNMPLTNDMMKRLGELENSVMDLLKLYNEGKELINSPNYAFGASLKIYRAYTGLRKVVSEMEAMLEKAQSGELERQKHMEELAKNLTKTIDGNLDDWNVEPVAVDDTGYGQDGANLKALYVDYDDQFLYIALTTENKASWRIAYGISLDYKDGGYTTGQDSWARKVQFSKGIDAQLYFFWNGEFFGDKGTSNITSAQLMLWNGTGWTYQDLKWVGFYAYTGGAENGLQTLEIAIPWSALGGKPAEINIVAYITGQGAGDSAVDSLPLQDAVKDTDPGQEWGDVDTFTEFAAVTIG